MLDLVWQNFLNIVREEVGSRVVDTWFKAVTLARWDALQKVVYLETPNSFVNDWLQKHYISLFQMHLGRLLHTELPSVVFTNLQEKKEEPEVRTIELPVQPVSRELVINTKDDHYRNKQYTFDTFVIGDHNKFAHAAAHAVAKRPGLLYNPLFIYGGSGLGKTHLLHAIGNAIKSEDKESVILYQTTNHFVNEFIKAIRFDHVHKFQKKYQAVDVLLIDDVHCISNKEQTQEAFFHIFNALYELNKQLVFSSDTFPQNITGIAERLRSRLACGLVTDILQPSLETKIAILKKKADILTEHISDEVAHFIASHVTSNIRELEGVLIRVVAFASLIKQPITLELVKKVMLKASTQEKPIDLERIMKGMYKYYPYSIQDLRSKNRAKEVTFARHVAILLIRRLTDKSLRDIGGYLGGRDHTTIKHALEKIEEYRKTNPIFETQLKQIEEEIYRL